MRTGNNGETFCIYCPILVSSWFHLRFNTAQPMTAIKQLCRVREAQRNAPEKTVRSVITPRTLQTPRSLR